MKKLFTTMMAVVATMSMTLLSSCSGTSNKEDITAASSKKGFDKERAEKIISNYETKHDGQPSSEKTEALDLLTVLYNEHADNLEALVEKTAESGDNADLTQYIYDMGNSDTHRIMCRLEEVSYHVTEREENNKAIEQVLNALNKAYEFIDKDEEDPNGSKNPPLFSSNYTPQKAIEGVARHFAGIYLHHSQQ